MTYSEKLKDPRWQKKRLEILERDKFTCQLCGDDETTLHVHHKKYFKNKEPWDINNKYLITLCKYCHFEVSLSELKKYPISKIRIYKSNGWTDNSRIMFVTVLHEFCSMRIYDKNDKFLDGYNLNYDISGIIDILKKAT